jgi:hypothetical protein
LASKKINLEGKRSIAKKLLFLLSFDGIAKNIWQKIDKRKRKKKKKKRKKWFSIPELREIKNDWRPCSTLFKTFYFPIPKYNFLHFILCFCDFFSYFSYFALSLLL